MSTDANPPKLSDLPQEERSRRLSYYIAEAEKYEGWRRKAQKRLLSDFAPRVASLGETGYRGCGFHYGMEQTLGKLVVSLSMPWQPCMNWLDNCPEESTTALISQVIFRSLEKQIAEAEATR